MKLLTSSRSCLTLFATVAVAACSESSPDVERVEHPHGDRSDADSDGAISDSGGAISDARGAIPVGKLAPCPEERIAKDACWRRVWEEVTIVPGNSGWGAIAVVDSDDIIVSGWVPARYLSFELPDDEPTFVRRLDAEKNHVWTNAYDSTPGDDAYAMAGSDSHGNVFLLGTSIYEETAGAARRRIYVAKVNDSGEELWTAEIGQGSDDRATFGVAVDSQENVYVTGRTSEAWSDHGVVGGGLNGVVIKLDSAGNVLWVHELIGASMGVLGVAVDEQDHAVLAAQVDGRGLVRKLGEDGTPLWTTVLSDDGSSAAWEVSVDAWGRIVVGGNASAMLTEQPLSGGRDAYVAQLDAEGNVLWVNQFGGPYGDTMHDVKVAPGGQIYALGTSSGEEPFSGHGFLMELNSEGTERRSIPLLLADGEVVHYPYDMAFDSRGHLYVVGAVLPEDGSWETRFFARDAVILELAPDAD